MEGCELRYINRKNKGGGGVALYVQKNPRFEVTQIMTNMVNNLLECVTTEIFKEKKNVIVSCLYRAPGTDSDRFKEWIEGMFLKSNNKVVYIC